ncbi:MAG: hypothetical protein F4X80_06885 [Chloroflexi bacterium]|nr:hypothetical protein [Chloroflexota bacterium]
MSADVACREPDARNLVSPEFEALRATLRGFTESFLADLDAMERRMIRTMVCTMLGGVLTVAVISVIV